MEEGKFKPWPPEVESYKNRPYAKGWLAQEGDARRKAQAEAQGMTVDEFLAWKKARRAAIGFVQGYWDEITEKNSDDGMWPDQNDFRKGR